MPHPICHFEIGCRDRARTKEFFKQLFDWKMEDAPLATFIQTGDDVGGHITELRATRPELQTRCIKFLARNLTEN